METAGSSSRGPYLRTNKRPTPSNYDEPYPHIVERLWYADKLTFFCVAALAKNFKKIQFVGKNFPDVLRTRDRDARGPRWLPVKMKDGIFRVSDLEKKNFFFSRARPARATRAGTAPFAVTATPEYFKYRSEKTSVKIFPTCYGPGGPQGARTAPVAVTATPEDRRARGILRCGS